MSSSVSHYVALSLWKNSFQDSRLIGNLIRRLFHISWKRTETWSLFVLWSLVSKHSKRFHRKLFWRLKAWFSFLKCSVTKEVYDLSVLSPSTNKYVSIFLCQTTRSASLLVHYSHIRKYGLMLSWYPWVHPLKLVNQLMMIMKLDMKILLY